MLWCAVLSSYTFATILGMLPVRYDRTAARFRTSGWCQGYSLVVLVLFSYGYKTSAVAVISALNPLIAIVFTDLTLGTISATVCLQCWQRHRIVLVLNRSKRIRARLDAVLLEDNYGGALVRFFVKVIAINAIAQCAVTRALHNLLFTITGNRDYLSIVLVSMAYFMQTIVPNMFFAAVLVARFYLVRVNVAIDALITEAGRLQEDDVLSAHGKQVRFCWISDRLDALSELHQAILELLDELGCIHSLQLLCSTLNFFGILIIEVRRISVNRVADKL